MHIDDDNELRKTQILKCNYILKWVVNGSIYESLVCLRSGNSYNSGSWSGDRLDFVDNILNVFAPTNEDVQTIGYNQRMIISEPGRMPPLCWQVSRCETMVPQGVSKFRFTQETFDPKHDNAELMLANYYDTEIIPRPNGESEDTDTIEISYNGTKPTIKVGGSTKVFVAKLPESNHFDVKWKVSDGVDVYGDDTYNNYTKTFGDYIITTTDRELHLKLTHNYELIGTILTVMAECADGSEGSVNVEVVG